ncbi:energy transducer TonB [Flaviaesturariibacter flavus]|nr:energy transducer TonB [Flaviaesturariibacter flavus]
MTHFDIQKASLLDLLFEQRNKQYGAYVLRKYYANRLSVALGLTLTAAFSIFFIAGRLGAPGASDRGSLLPGEGVVLKTFELPKPEKQPEVTRTVQKKMQTEHYTKNIQIVKDIDKPDLARIDALDKAVIGGHQATGDVPTADVHVDLPVGPKVVAPPVTPPAPPEEPTFVPNPSEAPQFPGGDAAWRGYLGKMLTTPSDMEAGEKRSVLVRFLVSEEGVVTGFQILRSGGASFDNEVLRVLRRMPRWKPARQNGRAVATAFQQPVTFQAPEE